MRCFDPWWEAATIAVPAAAGTSPWDPGPGWLAILTGALRGAAWIFIALLIAGIIRKQT